MIKVIQMEDDAAWDEYVAKHAMSHAYHSSHWQKIITKAYGHKAYALAAVSSDQPSTLGKNAINIKGLLPLIHLKSPFFGNRLVSMPFFDHGGIIADDTDCEEKLLQAAFALGKSLKAQHVELRHLNKIPSLKMSVNLKQLYSKWSLRSHKVRLLLPLPNSSEALMKAFKSKLRSQINRPIKAGLTVKIGDAELLAGFYNVFSTNMRDLGSPVHTKLLMEAVMEQFKDSAKIVLVYKADEPVAAALMVGSKEVMINPWASSLRQHSKESPNMLLYWSMLAYAADHGYRQFDFGRSTLDEGTYHFKTQWGADPQSMYWYTIWLQNKGSFTAPEDYRTASKHRAAAEELWRKLPVQVTKWIGPLIRKHISL